MSLWIAAPAVYALGLTALNLATWPRPRRPVEGAVSVLIPARNEQGNIEQAVRAAWAALPPGGEILVADDHSTDETPHILRRLAEEIPALRVIQPPPLPVGWVGKTHACHHLSLAATGNLLVFVDADVRLRPASLARLTGLCRDYRADVVTAYPQEQMGTAAEHHLMPLLALTYTSWLPLFLVWATRFPVFLAANGQILAVSAAAYAEAGGFEGVRSEVVDDMAFCRKAKQKGLRVAFADGRALATCRMYTSGAALWQGFAKNLYEGLGESPWRLAAVLSLYAWAFVVPWLALAAGLWGAPTLLGGAIGVAANLLQRAMLAASRGHRWSSLLTHPLAVTALLVLGIDSAVRTTRGGVTWAGRTYLRRAERGPA